MRHDIEPWPQLGLTLVRPVADFEMQEIMTDKHLQSGALAVGCRPDRAGRWEGSPGRSAGKFGSRHGTQQRVGRHQQLVAPLKETEMKLK